MHPHGHILLLLAACATPAVLGCAVNLSTQLTGDFDYVCDETVPWLHYDKSTGEWADATPPEGVRAVLSRINSCGSRDAAANSSYQIALLALARAQTGCHRYVALSGSAPKGCTVGASCDACSAPDGTEVDSVSLEGGTCEKCTSSNAASPPLPRTTSDRLLDARRAASNIARRMMSGGRRRLHAALQSRE